MVSEKRPTVSEAVPSPLTGIPRYLIVGSAKIEEAGHDPISGCIEVLFRTGAVWQFPKFDAYTFESFRRSGEKDAFFMKHIHGRDHPQSHIQVTQNERDDPRRSNIREPGQT